MNRPEITPDISRLAEGIRTEAEKYDLCCTVAVSDGADEQRIDLGGAGEDDVYALDCAGGVLLGLSVLMLDDDGVIDPGAPITDYIPLSELPKAAEHNRPLIMLCRRPPMPDPLHGILLPRLHRSAEFASLDGETAAKKEQEVLLAHRSLAAQTALLRENEELPSSGLHPSPLDEAILSELIRRVTGMSPADFVRRRILAPLGIVEAQSTDEKLCREDAVFLSVSGLIVLMRGIMDGVLLSENSMRFAEDKARGGHTLPFGRRQEILRARSCFCGCTVEMLLDMKIGVSVLVASHSPLPEVCRDSSFSRLDTDIAQLMSAQRIYPVKARMERLSPHNLADALALELKDGQREFVSAPAVAIADASVAEGEVYILREWQHAAVGLISMTASQLPDTILLDTLIIDRHYQRRGYGRIAVRWAMKYQRTRGAKALTVCVDRRNTVALALYDSLGFELMEVYDHAFVLTIDL